MNRWNVCRRMTLLASVSSNVQVQELSSIVKGRCDSAIESWILVCRCGW